MRLLSFEQLAQVIADYFQLSFEALKPESRLDADLGLDSLCLVEIVDLLEEMAAREVPDEVLENLTTLKDVYHYYSLYYQQSASGSAQC